MTPSVHDEAACAQYILAHMRTVAVVGLSPKAHRASYEVAHAMQRHGWNIIPINPKIDQVLGVRAYANLTDAAKDHHIELVNVFRNSADVPPVVDEAIAIGALALWTQLGVVHPAAAHKARDAGLWVVQDKCLKVEYAHWLAGQASKRSLR